MITIENDIVAGDALLWLRRNFKASFGSSGNGRHLFVFSVKRASEGSIIRAGSKMECVEHVIFISATHSFLSANENSLVRPELRHDILKRIELGTRMLMLESSSQVL